MYSIEILGVELWWFFVFNVLNSFCRLIFRKKCYSYVFKNKDFINLSTGMWLSFSCSFLGPMHIVCWHHSVPHWKFMLQKSVCSRLVHRYDMTMLEVMALWPQIGPIGNTASGRISQLRSNTKFKHIKLFSVSLSKLYIITTNCNLEATIVICTRKWRYRCHITCQAHSNEIHKCIPQIKLF